MAKNGDKETPKTTLVVPPVFVAPGTFEAVEDLALKRGHSIADTAQILIFNELRLIHSHLDQVVLPPPGDLTKIKE